MNCSFDTHPDALHQRLVALNSTDRIKTVVLLEALMEADRQRLYAARGYSSMYAYCQHGLKMEEGVICLRIAAARCAAQFGCILPMLREGSLSMAAVHLLRSSLTEQNHRELLAKAQHKSKRQIQQMLADDEPLADVAERVRMLPQRSEQSAPAPKTAGVETAAPSQQDNGCAVEPTAEGAQAASSSTSAKAPATTQSTAARPSGRTEPLGAKRYGVHFTATEQLHDKLLEAQALLSHTQDGSDLAGVVERALDELLKTLRKRKYAETDAPRQSKGQTSDGSPNNRLPIPAAVRRAVHERDGGRCSFVAEDGHRCDSTRLLEFHHIVPVGKGGATTLENVTLHCRAHNLFAAQIDFGLETMQQRVGQARSQAQGSCPSPTAAQGEAKGQCGGSLGQSSTHPAAGCRAPTDDSTRCQKSTAPTSQTTTGRRTMPSRTPSQGHSDASVHGRQRRGKELQPESTVLPGQLALPVQMADPVAEKPFAVATPADTTRPVAQEAA